MKKLMAWLKATRLTQDQAYALIPLLFAGSLAIVFVVNLIVYLVFGE